MPVYSTAPLAFVNEFPEDYECTITLSAIEVLILESILTPSINAYLWDSMDADTFDSIESAVASIQAKIFEVV